MTEPTQIGGVDGDRGSRLETGCSDALPCETDQHRLPGTRQTREQWLQENRQAIKR